MKLRIAMDDKKMDVRLRDRFMTEGRISKSEVETYLSSLDDDSANMERVEDSSEESSTEQ